jgi:hypothetical protein
MKVLWIGQWDWANTANRIARAMNGAAGEAVARVYTTNRHPFGYVEDVNFLALKGEACS